MKKEDIIKGLSELDLTPNEAKVYLELLCLGLVSTGPLIDVTKLHRQIVYNALDKLEDLDLVTTQSKNNTKHFQASSPSVLLDLVQKKKDLATSLVGKLQKLQSMGDYRLEVKTIFGVKSFVTNLKHVADSAADNEGVMCIVGGAMFQDFYETLGASYKNYVDHCQDLKIKKKLLVPELVAPGFAKKFLKEKNNELRCLGNVLTSPTYTRITQEIVTIEMYYPEVVVIQISNKAIAQSYLENFQFMWKQAKKYT